MQEQYDELDELVASLAERTGAAAVRVAAASAGLGATAPSGVGKPHTATPGSAVGADPRLGGSTSPSPPSKGHHVPHLLRADLARAPGPPAHASSAAARAYADTPSVSVRIRRELRVSP